MLSSPEADVIHDIASAPYHRDYKQNTFQRLPPPAATSVRAHYTMPANISRAAVAAACVFVILGLVLLLEQAAEQVASDVRSGASRSAPVAVGAGREPHTNDGWVER